MGTTLNGTQINNTYPGLLKTSDNGVLGATEKVVGDGLGNDSTLSLGTTSASFTGSLDLSGATLVGLPAAGNLINGTGTDSLTVNSALLTNAPEATQLRSIAIGDNARSRAQDCIIIGNGLVDDSFRTNSVVIGSHATRETKAAQLSTSIGSGAQAVGEASIAIGFESGCFANYATAITSTGTISMTRDESVFIGNGAGTTFAFGTKMVQIGWETKGAAQNSNAIGRGAKATGSWSSALAYNAESTGEQSTAVSYASKATAQGTFAAGDRAQAIGARSSAVGALSVAALTDSVALGAAVTAIWASGTTVNQLAMANYASINYADDTAAAAGGVPLGGVYHNAGALRVRIA